tara:strand:+ start:106 stop:357 length:252 start_codon:yes stop_codon:yes gene_type:complete
MNIKSEQESLESSLVEMDWEFSSGEGFVIFALSNNALEVVFTEDGIEVSVLHSMFSEEKSGIRVFDNASQCITWLTQLLCITW